MEDSLEQLENDIDFLNKEIRNIEEDYTRERRRSFLMARPQGPRWLSFGRFWAAQADFAKLGNEMEAAQSSRLSQPSSTSSRRTSTRSDNTADSPQKSDNSSTIDEEDALEQCTTMCLAVLRSYIHNLKQGTLVTEDKVDERIAECLQRLVGLRVKCGNVHETVMPEQRPRQEGSDEDGILCELETYQRIALDYDAKLDKDVLDAAKQVLAWGERKGIAKASELEKSWHGIFDMEL